MSAMHAWAVASVIGMLSACSPDRAAAPDDVPGAAASSSDPGTLATARRVVVSPRFAGMQVGATRSLAVVLRDSANNVILKPVAWSAGDATVATVNASGVITGRKVGSTHVFASVDGIRDSAAVSVNSIYGIEFGGFGPYIDGQNPDFGAVITEAQVRQRLLLARPYLRGVRNFGSQGGLEFIARVAREFNLQVICAAWIGTDVTSNAAQIAALVTDMNAGRCKVALVGSETQLRGDVTENALIAYINSVKAQRTNATPVATADVFHIFLTRPALRAAVDEIWVNIYPYHGGTSLAYAPAELHGQFNQIKSLAGGKRTVLGETGWPSCGATKGAAVPSLANAVSYFRSVISWSRATGNTVAYFEVFDEAWKSWRGNLEEACFGFLTSTGQRKTGVGTVFMGNVVPDTWTLPGGSGTPTLQLTQVPARGSFDDLRGQVIHLNTTTNQVAVYIKVNGLYWTKPTFATPATPIGFSGAFVTDITTGGSDEQATEIVVYVLPTSFAIPLVGGATTLPPSLDATAILKQVVVRP